MTEPTKPGMYAEKSPEGWSVWLIDEDGDWHEMPQRGEVLDPADCTYYRLVEIDDPVPAPHAYQHAGSGRWVCPTCRVFIVNQDCPMNREAAR